MNETHSCQPCPGSCQLFLNCKICSKRDCLSCPIGKFGRNCDQDVALQTPNDTISENTQTIIIQNITEVPHLETTFSEVPDGLLNRTLPKIIIFDVSQTNNASFERVAESNRPEGKIDLTENTSENTSIAEVVPEEKSFSNIPINHNENIIDSSEICTSNCSHNLTITTNNSFVSSMDVHKGNILVNGTGTFVDYKEGFGNESIKTSLESQGVVYKSEPLGDQNFDEVQQLQYSSVNIPINVSSYLETDYSNEQLMKHRSPNPSFDDDNTMTDSSSENNGKEYLQFEQDQQVFEVSEKDYQEKPLLSDNQETIEDIKNPTGANLKGSFMESENNAAPETKYVNLNTYDLPKEENEYKYLDVAQEESFPSEQDSVDVIKHNETNGMETIQSVSGQKYDFSKPHFLKQYFDSKEYEDPKSESTFPDLWKNMCKIFPMTSVCHSRVSTADGRNTLHPRHDPHAHIEHTFSYFRSPDYPGNKLLFSNTNGVPTDVPADIIKLRSMTNSDIVQQQSERLYDKLLRTHKSVPQSLNTYYQSTNPPQTFYNQGYPMNQSPVPPKDNHSAMNFQKGLFPSLFEHILQLIEPHISAYQDRYFSDEKREYGSSGIHKSTQTPLGKFKSLSEFSQTPVQAPVPPNLFGDYKFQSLSNSNPFRPFNFQDTNSNSLFSDQRRVPVVKGHVIIANIANENGTGSRIVPGSIRSQNFEFEIPMMMMPPSLHHPIYPSHTESRNSKTGHTKHRNGTRRLKKLHKRRRNGVKGDSVTATNKCNPWKEDCTKNHDKNIDSHTNFSGRKTKTLRMENAPDQVFIKYINMFDDLSNDSTEITATTKSNEIYDNIVQSKANEYLVQSQEKENEMGKPEQILPAPDESNSGI